MTDQPGWRLLEFTVASADYGGKPLLYEVEHGPRQEDTDRPEVLCYRLRLGPSSEIRVDGVEVKP